MCLVLIDSFDIIKAMCIKKLSKVGVSICPKGVMRLILVGKEKNVVIPPSKFMSKCLTGRKF